MMSGGGGVNVKMQIECLQLEAGDMEENQGGELGGERVVGVKLMKTPLQSCRGERI